MIKRKNADGTWTILTGSDRGSTGEWGSIAGTMSNQVDLDTALNGKLGLAGGTMTGTIKSTNQVMLQRDTTNETSYLNFDNLINGNFISCTGGNAANQLFAILLGGSTFEMYEDDVKFNNKSLITKLVAPSGGKHGYIDLCNGYGIVFGNTTFSNFACTTAWGSAGYYGEKMNQVVATSPKSISNIIFSTLTSNGLNCVVSCSGATLQSGSETNIISNVFAWRGTSSTINVGVRSLFVVKWA